MFVRVKYLGAGLVIGCVAGLWAGVNIGKGQSIYENPFKEKTVKQRVLESGSELLERGSEALQERID